MRLMVIMLTVMTLCVGNANAQTPPATEKVDSISVTVAEMADLLIDDAKIFMGRPYRWGANGPHAFDCSGFTKYIYAKFGYSLGRTVIAQMSDGEPVTGGLHNLQKGDILIYGSRKYPMKPGHVGIFIGLDESNEEFTFIHAARSGIIISKSSETYYKERFLGAVRILPNFVSSAPQMPYTQEKLDSLYSDVVISDVPDTLSLKPADRRIVLFEDGTWVIVGKEGEIILPESSGQDEVRIIYGNGTWKDVSVSKKQIPENRYDPQTEGAAAAAATQVYHTIKSGDTLSHLAVKYDTTVSEICRLNGIKSNVTLKLGMKLRVR